CVECQHPGAAQTRLDGVDTLAAPQVEDVERAERPRCEVASELHDTPHLDAVGFARLRHTGPALAALPREQGERLFVQLPHRLCHALNMDVDSCFRRAASFVAHASPASVLGTLFSAGPRLNELTDIVSQVDHVGFIASPVTVTSLAPAARAAGFDAGERTFPTTILAAELGQPLRGPAVPTTVFQASGTS